MFGASVVYVPSKNIILLIGGKSGDDKPLGIWKFCVLSQKWTKMNDIKFEHFNVSVALTSNEKYVIIAGGYDQTMHEKSCDHARQKIRCYSDSMFVLDISNDEQYTLKECTIKVPIPGHNPIVRAGGIKDECLVVGWIKELYKTKEFKDSLLPPMYLIQLIVKRYNQEKIHWVSSRAHYCISVKRILS